MNNHHDLTHNTIATLRKLSGNGIIICIATGRSFDCSLMKYINLLSLPQSTIPLVCYNGAYGLNYSSNNVEIITCNPLAENQIRLLINFSKELGLLLQVVNIDLI